MKFTKAMLLLCTVGMLAGCSNEKPFKLGLGGEGVPVGQYSSQILQHFGVDEEALARANYISYGADVKAVTNYITEGLVSCGIIYKTDAYSAGLTVVDVATEAMCGRVIYPAAVVKNNSGKKDVANSFLTYLTNADAMASFAKVGFVAAGSAVSETTQVSENVTLNVYAAASLTESLTEIKAAYEHVHSNITLNISFGSSGALQQQIEQGLPCDLFISAGAKQMNALQNHEGGSLIEDDTRINLLENKVALAVSSNPHNINSFADLAEKLKSLSK